MANTTLPNMELDRLLRMQHSDPHAILGAHAAPEGVVIRALQPGAEKVSVLANGGSPWSMAQRDRAGLFEVVIKDRREVFPYKLRVQQADGTSTTLYDPYSFLPTLGELDLHLWSEGRHERVYEKLGAHPRTMAGVAGVAFAVWAPNARGISVVGDSTAGTGVFT